MTKSFACIHAAIGTSLHALSTAIKHPWTKRLFTGSLFVFTLSTIFLFYYPFLFKPLNLYDEGVTVLGAKRFLLGELPYRDFLTLYGPLKFFVYGGSFGLFGTDIFVARATGLGIGILAFASAFLFFLRLSNAVFAMGGVFFLAIFGLPSLTTLFFFLLAFYLQLLWEKPNQYRLSFFGGSILSLLFLLRLDFGLYAGATIALLLFFFALSKRSWRFFWSHVGILTSTFFLLVTPVFIWLFSQGALPNYFKEVLYFPFFGDYKALRHLPWEPIAALRIEDFQVHFLSYSQSFAYYFFLLPVVLFFLLWGKKIITHFHKKYLLSRKEMSLFLTQGFLLFATLGVFLYVSHRSDYGHTLSLNVMASFFFLSILLSFRKKIFTLFFLPLFALLGLYPLLGPGQLLESRTMLVETEKKDYSFSKHNFPISPENEALEAVLKYFEKIPKEELVFIGVHDSSKIFINNVMLWFFLDRPVPTRYHELHTGIVTQANVQYKIIDEIRDVRHLVLWDYGPCPENNGSCQSTGNRMLDEYIETHYKVVEQRENYTIMEKQ